MLGWAASVVLGLNVLSKGVRTGPTATHFGLAYVQTMPRLPGFDHRPMVGRAAVGKL